MDALISKSQMELHHGYIIYLKLLFLPGNPWICPHLHGTYKEMTSIKMKTDLDHSYFSPSYLSTIFVFHFLFSLFSPTIWLLGNCSPQGYAQEIYIRDYS